SKSKWSRKNASAAGTSLRIGTCTTAPTEVPKRTWSARNDSFASCAGMSHGLTVMAPSGFLSRLTKCAESQDLRLESLDVRKATLAKVLARAAGKWLGMLKEIAPRLARAALVANPNPPCAS